MNIMGKALALVGGVLLGASAQAAIVTYNFAGTTTYATIPGTAGTFHGTLSYDTADPVVQQYTVGAAYRGNPTLHVVSGSLDDTMADSYAAGHNFQTALIFNNYYMGDEFSFGFYLADKDSYGFNGGTIILTDPTGTVFNSADLPSSLDLAKFSEASVSLHGPFEDHINFLGRITSLTLQGAAGSTSAPKPASWAMMIAGFGGIGGVLRRRKSTAAIA